MLSPICNIIVFCKDNKKKIIFNKINEINVTTSIHNLTDTCTITLPKNFTNKKGNTIFDYLTQGDEIIVKTKYAEHKDWHQIFRGYITNINDTTPATITCQNEMYRLKKVLVQPEKIEQFNLETWFKKYVNDIKIKTVGDIKFGSLDINSEMTMAEALLKLLDVYSFLKCYFYKDELVFTMLASPSAEKDAIVLGIGKNVITDSLEYVKAEDVKVCIKATSIIVRQNKNEKLEVMLPEGAKNLKDYEQRHFHVPECTTEKELRTFAENKLKEFKVDKLTGSVTLFGVPRVEKTDIVHILSPRKNFNDRLFFVDAVTYQFGLNGYRQIVNLGYQIKKTMQ